MKPSRTLMIASLILMIPLQAYSQTWQQAAPAGTAPGALQFGGIYKVEADAYQFCFVPNPGTGSCTCPAGFSRAELMREFFSGDSNRVTFYCYRA